MNELKVFEENGELYTDSRDVAEMIDKRHSDLVRSIETYIGYISANAKLRSPQFFVESFYLDSQNKKRRHYLLTKKGCDMVANKMTGEKGILFTAMYVDQFHKMEDHIKSKQYELPTNPMDVLELMFKVQKEDRAAVKQVTREVNNIREIVSMETKSWRDDTNRVLNRIAKTLGGGAQYKEIRNEAYQGLISKGRCNLEQRLKNRKNKAAGKGASKSTIQSISKLDVINEEPRLIEIYISVIQKMAIKYNVDFSGIVNEE